MSSKARNLLSSGVTNVAQSFYDNFVQSNAELRASAGVRAVIIRRVNRPCCDWCKSLEGRYDIDDAPDNIYSRHKDCDCTVVCYDEKGYTDAWSKKVYQTEQEARKANAREIEAKQKRKTTEHKEEPAKKETDLLDRARLKTGSMTRAEYAGYKQELKYAEQTYKQIQLPRDEYAHIMSELNTNLSEEDRKHAIITKTIGSYEYTFINKGFNDYIFVKKVRAR
jgi:hypothetical protein